MLPPLPELFLYGSAPFGVAGFSSVPVEEDHDQPYSAE
jgi:hypothetical protein